MELNVKITIDQNSPFLHSNQDLEDYLVIENQNIGDRKFNDLVVSGALLSLSHFENVTFCSCVFFATCLENVSFANCTFIGCKFQFTTLTHCHFANSSLRNCVWEASNINKSNFYNCEMDFKTSHKLLRGDNRITRDPAYAEAA